MDKKTFKQFWDEFLASDEGKKCLEGSATGVYLKNRLWRAFKVGFDAGRIVSHLPN